MTQTADVQVHVHFVITLIAEQERTISDQYVSLKTAAKLQPLLAPTDHVTHDATM